MRNLIFQNIVEDISLDNFLNQQVVIKELPEVNEGISLLLIARKLKKV